MTTTSQQVTEAMVEAGLSAAERACCEATFGDPDYGFANAFTDEFKVRFRRMHKAALEAALSVQREAPGEAVARAAWEIGRTSFCPAGILDDKDRTERAWQKAKDKLAALMAKPQEPSETVDRFGMIDEASGHNPLYFGKVNGLAPHAIAGEQYVRLSDYRAALPAQAEPTPLAVPKKGLEQLTLEAVTAVEALSDWAHENEGSWSGWGEQTIPPGATFWRVKADQALKALGEIRPRYAAPEPKP